jgi:tRNA threonylcarbamoyladenosine biosynthesis protein TsaE
VTVTTRSEEETAQVGRDLAAGLGRGAVVLLHGDLGAGKTALVRGLAEGLGIDPGEVTSPTFTIVQEYRGGHVPLMHVDLYRIEPKEVDDLGLDELAADAVLAVEWAERMPRPPAGAIHVTLTHGPDGSRVIDWGGNGNGGVAAPYSAR